ANRIARLIFNTTKAPFNNPDFRKAISYATPYQQILSNVYFGLASPLKGPIPPDYPYSAPGVWNFNTDPAHAKQLLTKAGIDSGTSFTIHYDSGRTDYRDIAAILETAYKAVGLNVSVEGDPEASFFTDASKRKYD